MTRERSVLRSRPLVALLTAEGISSLPDTDPVKQEFGRLHGLSNILMLVTLAGGIGLLAIETTDTH